MKYVVNGLVSRKKILEDLNQIEKRYEEDKKRIHDYYDELSEVLENPPSMPDYSGGQCFYKILQNDKDFLFNMKTYILTLPHIGATKKPELRAKIANSKSVLELIKIYIEEES